MKTFDPKNPVCKSTLDAKRLVRKTSLTVGVCLTILCGFTAHHLCAEDVADQSNNEQKAQVEQVAEADNIIGIRHFCVHVLELEKTMKLYREILGFKMVKSTVFKGEGIEGMLMMELRAGNAVVNLSLPSEQYKDTVGPIGNTNHNHLTLLVNDIVPICDKLKAEGYALENENYRQSPWTFFTGPNGEILGLTENK